MSEPLSSPEDPGPDDLASIIRRARKAPEEVAALVSMKKEHVAVSIMKPPTKGKYWRVRDGEGWSYQENSFLMLPPEFEGDRKDFLLVRPDLEEFVLSKPQLRAVVRTVGLAFMVDAHGGPAYWALNLGDSRNWGASARAIVAELTSAWGTVCSEAGRYVLVRPEDDLGEPIWPVGSPDDWLGRAFKDRIIDSKDHPEIKKLLGKK